MSARLRVPERVGIVGGAEGDDAVYVAKLPSGPIVVLRDTALTIWQEAMAPTGHQDLAERVAGLYGVPVNQIRGAVHACVLDLVAQGILEPAPDTEDQ